MNRFNKPEEIAYTRAKILNPLLDPALDHTARVALRRKISEQEGISERTLRRWWKDYKAEGFSGLIPKLRETPSRNAIPEAIVDEAVLLRREIPERSVRDIIHLLELEGRISPGSIKRSSLQARLEERGYGARQLKMYASSGAGAHRRFEYQERNGLWQADIKYLLHLQGDAKNAGKQLYVSAFIDDATRMVTACRVYDRQDAPAVLDSFRAALAIYGVPERLFTDNGKPYVSKAMHQVCQSLGIHLLRAKPYAAASKGKIEAFNRTLEKFVQEAQLERPKSIAQVQHDLDCWLENFYYTQPHSALKGKTPRQAFNEQIRPLRFLTIEQLNEAFLYKECRLVDKTGCISFQGRKWEAGSEYIGLKVELSYPDLSPEVLTIQHKLFEPKQIRPLQMASYTRKEQLAPASASDGSRLLRQARKTPPPPQGATRFRELPGGLHHGE